jgi:hypothetical protein
MIDSATKTAYSSLSPEIVIEFPAIDYQPSIQNEGNNPDRNSRPDRAPKTYQWDVLDGPSIKHLKAIPSKTKKDRNAEIDTVPCERTLSVPLITFWLQQNT